MLVNRACGVCRYPDMPLSGKSHADSVTARRLLDLDHETGMCKHIFFAIDAREYCRERPFDEKKKIIEALCAELGTNSSIAVPVPGPPWPPGYYRQSVLAYEVTYSEMHTHTIAGRGVKRGLLISQMRAEPDQLRRALND